MLPANWKMFTLKQQDASDVIEHRVDAPCEISYEQSGIGKTIPPPDFFAAKNAQLLMLLQEFLGEASRLKTAPVTLPTEDGILISTPEDAYQFLRVGMQDLEQEQLRILNLNIKNRLLSAPTVYKGSVHTVVIRLPEIFRPAILANASSIIVAHNHPTGDPTPGIEDIALTRELVRAGELMDLPVYDHLIIGRNSYVSLGERGLGI